MPNPKVEVKLEKINTSRSANDTPIGTIGHIRNSSKGHEGRLVIRTYTGVTALDGDDVGDIGDVGDTWSHPVGFDIEPLPKGSIVTITID